MKIDYDKIKQEYISTETTLEELAKKYDVSKSTLYKKSSAGKWNSKRKEYGKKVENKFMEKASSKQSSDDVKKLERLIRAADKMAEQIEKAMEDPEQFNRHLVNKKVRKKDGSEKAWVEEEKFDKFDTRAMRELTSTMKELSGVIRSLNGIPEETEKKDTTVTVVFGDFEEYAE